jgi:hypothetical protein
MRLPIDEESVQEALTKAVKRLWNKPDRKCSLKAWFASHTISMPESQTVKNVCAKGEGQSEKDGNALNLTD